MINGRERHSESLRFMLNVGMSLAKEGLLPAACCLLHTFLFTFPLLLVPSESECRSTTSFVLVVMYGQIRIDIRMNLYWLPAWILVLVVDDGSGE